jgi:superfamily II DNA helicase RecQ
MISEMKFLDPAGGGKSMTFQLPGLAKGNCFTVVVGPLMALAKDQVSTGRVHV